MTGPSQTEHRDVEWFNRTGHCGKCGQPGNYCRCTWSARCGCRTLHVMGSGLDADAIERFAEPPPDQDGLF